MTFGDGSIERTEASVASASPQPGARGGYTGPCIAFPHFLWTA
jgi:hypothetical protein